jgi:glycerol-3-phosphate dehydrogenase (NAD(P)+)
MKIVVIGAGAWGTALSVCAASGAHEVRLLARDAQQAQAMQAQRENVRYLPGVRLPDRLQVLSAIGAAQERMQAQAQQADLIIIATPMAALEGCLRELQSQEEAQGTPLKTPVAWLCKGFDAQGRLGHEIADALGFNAPFGVLSGPSFAQEVARGQPTALVAASAHAALRERLVQAFHSERLRVYDNDDVIGVEVGGAVKNVLAIATGLCDGLQLGLNARAALITRGLAEMTRLGLALGAKAETFMGLSGLGDLVLTATGDLSRNRQVGLRLAQGQSLSEITQSLGHVAEGVRCASAVHARARQLQISMPITQCVSALLAGQIAPQEAVSGLMGREPVSEGKHF